MFAPLLLYLVKSREGYNCTDATVSIQEVHMRVVYQWNCTNKEGVCSQQEDYHEHNCFPGWERGGVGIIEDKLGVMK